MILRRVWIAAGRVLAAEWPALRGVSFGPYGACPCRPEETGAPMILRMRTAKAVKLTIRDALATVVVLGLGMAILMRETAYRNRVIVLEGKASIANSDKAFREFMAATFGELGAVVMKDPHVFRIYPASANDTELYDPSPAEILSLISKREGELVAPDIAVKLYNEFTQDNLDYLSSSYDPVPTGIFRIERNGDTTILISGEEHGAFVKVFVLDTRGRFRNKGRAWMRIQSATINELLKRPMLKGREGREGTGRSGARRIKFGELRSTWAQKTRGQTRKGARVKLKRNEFGERRLGESGKVQDLDLDGHTGVAYIAHTHTSGGTADDDRSLSTD
jgi:hypothetical protein